MVDETSLDDILNGQTETADLNETGAEVDLNTAPEPAEPEKGASDTADPEQPAEGESPPEEKAKGEDAAEDDKAGEPPSSEPKEPEPATIPVAALHDERRKRQNAEAQLSQMQKVALDAQAPDPLLEPEEYQRFQDEKYANERYADKVNISTELVREIHGEDAYYAAETAFLAEVEKNPSLAVALRESEAPALFAFKVGQDAIKRAEMGDPETFGQRKFDEGYQKAKAEMDATIAERVKAELAQHLPKSLAEETSHGTRSSGPAWDGPKPLAEILPK